MFVFYLNEKNKMADQAPEIYGLEFQVYVINDYTFTQSTIVCFRVEH